MTATPPPRVAILGRPNVGKSSLFNRLVRRRLAIVDDTPGVTRDRREARAEVGGREVLVVDTAGLEESPPDTVPGRMRASSEAALRAADLVLFVVDARAGVTPGDRAFADLLRRSGKPVVLLANKAEGRQGAARALEAYELGLGDPLPVSAEHGDGFGELHDEIAARLPPVSEADAADGETDGAGLGVEGDGPTDEEAAAEALALARADRPLRLAIVGRPNAGKSTLLNALVGEERMITGPEPGLTRDAVAVEWTDETGGRVRLVDTAGLRKKARVHEGLEQMSAASTIAALKECEVCVLVLDALLGMDEQDLRIARLAEREGRACVLALNKWDAVEDRTAARRALSDVLERSLAQSRGIPVVTMSAQTGRGVDRLMPAVREAYRLWNRRVGTGELNRWLEAMLARHQPPLVEGKRLKLRYATMPKARPPTITVFGTRADLTPEDYRRFLVNGFREAFGMPGVPIRLHLRGTENPFREGEDRG